ncbi:GNAT family N-acetyltransferase [Halobacillus salinus]|uniref:N-acetyltransferase n=1 Tax=Halobacillus salinus TaxID=192814 RepID=A0A4Z0H3E3_9BACI|nr:GNAT family N-acetyltransferase [Halobacillus salinus]TGB04912.1 N-acetyltransferase [Halobacillus salinus]
MVPNLETERLLLRERKMTDLEDCLQMDRDPEVVKHIPEIRELLESGLSAERQKAFITDRMQKEYPNGLGYWTIEHKQDPGVFLGWVMLIPLDAIGPEVEAGWRLNRDSWGKGFATEASKAVIRHGFGSLELSELVCDIHPENGASIKVAEKLGFAGKSTTSDGYVRYRLKADDFDFAP